MSGQKVYFPESVFINPEKEDVMTRRDKYFMPPPYTHDVKSLPTPAQVEAARKKSLHDLAKDILHEFKAAMLAGSTKIPIQQQDYAALKAAKEILDSEGDWELTWTTTEAEVNPKPPKGPAYR